MAKKVHILYFESYIENRLVNYSDTIVINTNCYNAEKIIANLMGFGYYIDRASIKEHNNISLNPSIECDTYDIIMCALCKNHNI